MFILDLFVPIVVLALSHCGWAWGQLLPFGCVHVQGMLWPLHSCSGVFMTTLQGPKQLESVGGGWTLQTHQSVSSLWGKAKAIFIFPWVERESTEAREKNGKEWMRNPLCHWLAVAHLNRWLCFDLDSPFFCLPTKGDLQSSVQKGSNTAACSHTSGAKGERLWEFPASFPCLLLFLFPQEITVWENSPLLLLLERKTEKTFLTFFAEKRG